MNEFRGRLLPDDSPPSVRARRTFQRLADAAAIEPLQREINLRVKGYRFEWGVHVVRDDTINAFCLPAGKVFLLTGILKVIGDNGVGRHVTGTVTVTVPVPRPAGEPPDPEAPSSKEAGG